MKKVLLFLAAMFALPFAGHAEEWYAGWQNGWDAELRVASFYPTSKLFREIYSPKRICYELEVSRKICGNYFLWINTDWFHKHGHSIGFENKTKINLIPVSMGVKYLYPVSCRVGVYAGAGVSYAFLHINNHSRFVHRHVNRQGFGGVVKTGVRINITHCAFLDVFGDYLYQRFHFRHHSTEVGGFKFGAGVGVNF